jgi:hypothetical protein
MDENYGNHAFFGNFIRLAFKLTAGRIMQAAPARVLNEWAVR